MNRNVTALILVVLAVGISVTVTKGVLEDAQIQKANNDKYVEVLTNIKNLITLRDRLMAEYRNISPDDKERLNKMIPSGSNNIQLIVDMTELASTKHNLPIKNIRAETVQSQGTQNSMGNNIVPTKGVVKITFGMTGDHEKVKGFISDIERSLRIMDITKFNLKASDTGVYEYSIEINTYWLRS